jgi:hypothetical protein
MTTQNPASDPYTEADIAAIIAAPGVPLTSNMNPWLGTRLQHLAAIEAENQDAENAGSWTWELAQLFSQCFGGQPGEPFIRFYREASRRLIGSDHVRAKSVDLSYLLFATKQSNPAELSNNNILDTLRQHKK